MTGPLAASHTDLDPALLKFWAPKIYQYYLDLARDLKENDPTLREIETEHAFHAMSFNFGPQATTCEHTDHQNYAGGYCVVTSLGTYDASQGGHLFLRELGLVVEFPVGASVLLPSALIAHGNTRIGSGEYRASITSYTAGGNVRWRDQKYKTQGAMSKAELDEYNAALTSNWREAIKRISKIDEIAEDHRQLGFASMEGLDAV